MITNIHYFRPNTFDEASALLATTNTRNIAIAGATSWAYNVDINAETLIDLGQLGLDQIEQIGEQIHIGAMVSLQMLVETGQTVADNHPLYLLNLAAHDMAAIGLRHRSTIGGAIISADNASPIVTALLALNAEVLLFSPNSKDQRKTVALAGFLDYHPRLLKGGVIVLGLIVPFLNVNTVIHYEKVARTPADYPIVCVASVYAIANNVLANVRIAAGGVATKPMLLSDLCFALASKPPSQLNISLNPALAVLNPPSNWLGSSDYRRAMVGVLIKRSLK